MTPVEVALAYLQSFGAAEPKRVCRWVTEDFTNNQVSQIGECFQGRDLYEERLSRFFARFSGLEYRAINTIAQGNMVAVCYEMAATDAGHAISIRGVMVMWVRGERVERRDDYWDGLTYLRQVGVAMPFEQAG